MSFRPRHLLIRYLLPWAWKRGGRNRILFEFADTELDSGWQSLHALEFVEQKSLRKMLFRHALEEIHHAELFLKLADQTSTSVLPRLQSRRTPLKDDPAGATYSGREAAEILAYLNIGESEILHDFAVYEKSLEDEDARALLREITADEMDHAESADRALAKIAQQEGLGLRFIKLRYLWDLTSKRYRLLGQRFGTLPMTLMLGFAYFICGPIFAAQARRRLSLDSAEQLKLVDQQLKKSIAKIGKTA